MNDPNVQNVEIVVDDFVSTLINLLQGGISISTIIDIGSGDGQFGLHCLLFKRDLHVLNIDANHIFESSLREIKDKLGIPYRILALSNHHGTLTMSNSSSENPYGFGVNNNTEDNDRKQYIDCTTLDSLLGDYNFPEPYFIKMDVEDAEFAILQGSEKTLSKTAAILMEQHVQPGKSTGDFNDRFNYLAGRNFSLFDIKEIHYQKRNLNLKTVNIKIGNDSNPEVLSVFHPVFINDKYDFRKVKDQQKDQSKQAYEIMANEQALNNRRLKVIELNRKLITQLRVTQN